MKDWIPAFAGMTKYCRRAIVFLCNKSSASPPLFARDIQFLHTLFRGNVEDLVGFSISSHARMRGMSRRPAHDPRRADSRRTARPWRRLRRARPRNRDSARPTPTASAPAPAFRRRACSPAAASRRRCGRAQSAPGSRRRRQRLDQPLNHCDHETRPPGEQHDDQRRRDAQHRRPLHREPDPAPQRAPLHNPAPRATAIATGPRRAVIEASEEAPFRPDSRPASSTPTAPASREIRRRRPRRPTHGIRSPHRRSAGCG